MKSISSACSPDQNAVVLASAGTGKTWLLVTRLLHLLMAGISPDSILAITFTRKAAAEMQARLLERLFTLITLDNEQLAASLAWQGISVNEKTQKRARYLYEYMLNCEQPIRITTFHAFCHEILKKFPTEANVPPGFELLETGGLLVQEAYDALFTEATACPDGELAQALDALLAQSVNTTGLNAALDEFIQHRADWWAFTRTRDNPVEYASNKLAERLQIDNSQDPSSALLAAANLSILHEFMTLLEKHPTQHNQNTIAAICMILDHKQPSARRLKCLKDAFLTKEGKPLARKHTKTLEKALGHEGVIRLLEIHESVCVQLGEFLEIERRMQTYNTSRAWYLAGGKLLQHYQRIKGERRMLDFVDLELKVHELLNHSDNALWIQYKLDQRIDHLLIDEFQDTNPIQWGMILPLLNELAAGHHAHKRSIFLVGDSKQSIYRFRRANPRLVNTARHWLDKHLTTKQYTLDVSWRSSPAIINFINRIFSTGTLAKRLHSYPIHDTHLHNLWGKVEILPLVYAKNRDITSDTGELRNPLQAPRSIMEDQRHYREGTLIAQRIKGLMQNNTLIGHNDAIHPLTYNDIFILARNRTHLPAYERALRDNLIPYLSTGRTILLDNLEVQDMVALLETLIAPFNNLSLATVLRSPLFDCSDDDLMIIASHIRKNADGSNNKMTWMECIIEISPMFPDGSKLKRAGYWLVKWRALVGHLPVHDLLDRIYTEGNVLERYQAAFPDHLQQRVTANLSRFIELALEIDSGRYPSLSLFLSRLCSMRKYAREELDEPPVTTGDSVRIMTIHAAKGLEAAVVFLVDTTKSHTRNRPYRSLITWPDEADMPDNFFITGKKTEMDQWSRTLSERSEQEELQEEANLLYVALSRARQLLYISGCAPLRGDSLGWYGLITENIADEGMQVNETGYCHETGHPPSQPTSSLHVTTQATVIPDTRLSQPFTQPQYTNDIEITPSHLLYTVAGPELAAIKHDEDDDRLRGKVIHRLLELTTSNRTISEQALLQHVADEFALDRFDPLLGDWWQEVQGLIHQPALQPYFDPGCYSSAYNEVSIQYTANGRLAHGVIDRLIVDTGEIIVIDYKTNRRATLNNLAALAAPYREQIRLYGNGAMKIWPQKTVRLILIFTACAAAYELNADTSVLASDSYHEMSN